MANNKQAEEVVNDLIEIYFSEMRSEMLDLLGIELDGLSTGELEVLNINKEVTKIIWNKIADRIV